VVVGREEGYEAHAKTENSSLSPPAVDIRRGGGGEGTQGKRGWSAFVWEVRWRWW
jgi:hypothetical protein